MQLEARKLLLDMQRAAAQIAGITSGRSLEDYRQDQQLRWAVERGFEIVGEALGQLSKVDAALAGRISEYRQIIGFRNVLIHGYSTIDATRTWDIVQRDLPTLRKELEELLVE
jgi:uncharacterized protein with HEPN domain